jgi:hypothetical protein
MENINHIEIVEVDFVSKDLVNKRCSPLEDKLVGSSLLVFNDSEISGFDMLMRIEGVREK